RRGVESFTPTVPSGALDINSVTRASAAGVRLTAAGRWRVVVSVMSLSPLPFAGGDGGWMCSIYREKARFVQRAHLLPPGGGRLQHTQFEPGLIAHLGRIPRRIPNQRDFRVAHARYRQDPHLDFAGHGFGDRAVRGSQRHRHFDIVLFRHLDTVDQPEIVDVHRDLGIVDALQRLDHTFVERAAGGHGVVRRRLLREEPFQVVLLAAELRVGRFLARILDAGPGRGLDPVDFFHGEALVGFFHHLILRHAELVSASIPQARAAVRGARWTLNQVQSLPRTRSGGDELRGSSSENPLGSFDPAQQRGDIVFVAVESEAGSCGGRDAEALHQWLRAVVAGANGDVLFVQDGPEIVRVNAVEREADDAGAVVGPEQAHVVHPSQRLAKLRDQRGLVGVDRVEADAGDVVASGGEPDRLDDGGRAGLEALRRGGVSGLLESHALDHRTATLPRGHRGEEVV